MTRKYTRHKPPTANKTPNPLGLEYMSVRLRGSDREINFHIPNLIDVLRNPKTYDERGVEEAMRNAANIIEATSGVAGFKSVIGGPTIYGAML